MLLFTGLSQDQLMECQDNDIAPPTRPAWISDIMWRQCQNLEAKFDSFSHLCPSIVNTPNQWTTLAQSHDPYHLMVTKYTPTQEEGIQNILEILVVWTKVIIKAVI